MRFTPEGFAFREYFVEPRYKLDHVARSAPVEVVLAVHIYLLAAVPLNSVGDSPGSLPAQQRRELDSQPRIALAALRKAVVVVGLRKMHESSILLASRYGARQIPLERATVVGLEDL